MVNSICHAITFPIALQLHVGQLYLAWHAVTFFFLVSNNHIFFVNNSWNAVSFSMHSKISGLHLSMIHAIKKKIPMQNHQTV